MSVQAVIFDCFGVIYDSPLAIFLSAIYDERVRHTVLELFHAYDHSAIDKPALQQALATATNKSVTQIEQELFSGFRINPQTVDYIKELRHTYKVGLLTNVGAGIYEKLQQQLEPLFDEIVASYKVKITKPDQAIYKLMATRLGVALSECVFIDDQQKHCDGAKKVGMKAILFQDTSQLQSDLSHLLNANK